MRLDPVLSFSTSPPILRSSSMDRGIDLGRGHAPRLGTFRPVGGGQVLALEALLDACRAARGDPQSVGVFYTAGQTFLAASENTKSTSELESASKWCDNCISGTESCAQGVAANWTRRRLLEIAGAGSSGRENAPATRWAGALK